MFLIKTPKTYQIHQTLEIIIINSMVCFDYFFKFSYTRLSWIAMHFDLIFNPIVSNYSFFFLFYEFLIMAHWKMGTVVVQKDICTCFVCASRKSVRVNILFKISLYNWLLFSRDPATLLAVPRSVIIKIQRFAISRAYVLPPAALLFPPIQPASISTTCVPSYPSYSSSVISWFTHLSKLL